jgi:hypothetical protein
VIEHLVTPALLLKDVDLTLKREVEGLLIALSFQDSFIKRFGINLSKCFAFSILKRIEIKMSELFPKQLQSGWVLLCTRAIS